MKAAILAERARRSGSRSFAAFVKQAWHLVPQVEPLVWSWHMQAICDHLEAVARGTVTQLVINIPPGHSKSVLVAVLWPAWIWTWWPQCQMLFGSYSHDYVIRDARRCRDVVSSEWYREQYSRPGGWRLRNDHGGAGNFSNTAGGVRHATSVGGAGAGLRAHVIGIDDPINIEDAYSEAVRKAAVSWLSQTVSQRFIAGHEKKLVLVMQRLHAQDPTVWMKSQGAEMLVMPSEFDPAHPCVTYQLVGENGTRRREEFWRDPRTEAGELLFPEMFPRARIESDKSALGPFGYASQHGQRPAPPGGGMFKVQDWRFWRWRDEPDVSSLRPKVGEVALYAGAARALGREELEEVLISVDATFKKTTAGSYVAIHVIGKVGSRRILLERVHRRMDFNETVKALLGVIDRWPEARRKRVEAKANGDAIADTLEQTHAVTGIERVNPGDASKEQRAHAMLPLQAGNNCELHDGTTDAWEMIAEHAEFPNGPHNDDVDAWSQGLQGFERKGAPAWLTQEQDWT